MELAAQELSSRQLAKIAELTKQIEKKASVLENVYKANIDKLKRFAVREDTYVVTTEPIPQRFRTARSDFTARKGSPPPTGLEPNKSYILSGNEFLNDQTFRSAYSARDANASRVNKTMRVDKGYQKQTSKKGGRLSPNRSMLNGTNGHVTLGGGHKRVLSVNKMHSSPSRQGTWVFKLSYLYF